MKNLFIDTNIWLSLYHFTNDDLAQFQKLKNYVGKSIRLIIPEQVKNEVRRNRENKLKDALKDFKMEGFKFTVYCKEYDEYDDFARDYNDLKSRLATWKGKIVEDIINEKLPADKAIRELFEKAEILQCDKYVDSAYTRYRIGNPPGKDNKYGDAINWECLLDQVPDGEDLFFISGDSDFASGYGEFFNPFLSKEWKEKKGSSVIYYKKLVAFLNEHVKEIRLKIEEDKQHLIDELGKSPSFLITHGIIELLSRHDGWSSEQIEELCRIAEENEQVARIFNDRDIITFYSNLLSKIRPEQLEDSSTKRLFNVLFGDAFLE